jgi:hypothetical protein
MYYTYTYGLRLTDDGRGEKGQDGDGDTVGEGAHYNISVTVIQGEPPGRVGSEVAN